MSSNPLTLQVHLHNILELSGVLHLQDELDSADLLEEVVVLDVKRLVLALEFGTNLAIDRADILLLLVPVNKRLLLLVDILVLALVVM